MSQPQFSNYKTPYQPPRTNQALHDIQAQFHDFPEGERRSTEELEYLQHENRRLSSVIDLLEGKLAYANSSIQQLTSENKGLKKQLKLFDRNQDLIIQAHFELYPIFGQATYGEFDEQYNSETWNEIQERKKSARVCSHATATSRLSGKRKWTIYDARHPRHGAASRRVSIASSPLDSYNQEQLVDSNDGAIPAAFYPPNGYIFPSSLLPNQPREDFCVYTSRSSTSPSSLPSSSSPLPTTLSQSLFLPANTDSSENDMGSVLSPQLTFLHSPQDVVSLIEEQTKG
ncbi:hypothetical protein HD806DRAFT_536071 [Xylariaceae sp. AK1471]|nr:hypothetical protein HD806DRAFT_536071 [Xylariaceae sp. AK1471]